MKDREKIVEAMALAIRQTDPRTPLTLSELELVWAHAALSALESELSSRGLAILPVEATGRMITDGSIASVKGNFAEIYRAMVCAYLKKD